MKYGVAVTIVQTGYIEVEADCEAEAKAKAEKTYFMEKSNKNIFHIFWVI